MGSMNVVLANVVLASAGCKHTYNEPGRDVTWTALVISVCSV